MKHFLVFILILVSNAIFACGFYPYGEELRFSFFNPLHFKYSSYSEFYYSSNSFSPNENTTNEKSIDGNEELWLQYCKNKVSIEAIRRILFDSTSEDITGNSTNEMLRYLYKIKDLEAINYLKFAKKCEIFNGIFEDPWERNQMATSPKRAKLINEAILLSGKVSKEELKLRYTFLAIRLSYYNNDKAKIIALYDTVFRVQKKNTILKYWSLYFRVFAENNNALSNFYAAQVFVNAPDKRFMISGSFNGKVPLDSVQEKANVYFLAGVKKSDRALECLKQIYKYNPKFDGLSFLLLREINKIEDWVFTPYYSLFNPSISSYDENEKDSAKDIMQRVEKDRIYAGQVLDFINHVDLKKAHDPFLWKLSKAYLSFVTKDNQNCLNQISELEKNVSKKDSLYNQMEIIKALALTANQTSGKAIIQDEVKSILLKNKDKKKFIFAIGRELEYKQNLTDAAFLYSKLMEEKGGYNYNDEAYWRSSKGRKGYYSEFYSDYFDYVNMFYTPKQVEDIVSETLKNNSDEFSIWKYSYTKKQLPLLNDLIGTKYIRQNNLDKALFYFRKNNDDKEEKVNKADCVWEKEDCNNVYKDPFFALKYTQPFTPQKDLFKLSKYAVTKQLISLLKKAANPAEKNKDYYNFLVANCYYNMTYYGSLQEMRRYGWSSYMTDYPVEDNDEFYECNLAKKYYLLALKNAKTEKFKALCLRMIGKCEKNRLQHKHPNDYYNRIENYDEFLFSKNKYYQDLKSKYSDDYDNLMSDCSSFEEYFKARR